MRTEAPAPPRAGAGLPLVVAGAAFVLTLYATWDRCAPAPLHRGAAPRTVTPRGSLTELEQSTIAVYEATRSAVVHITTPGIVQQSWRGLQQVAPPGTGSGFVWDARGYVVTNYHVVAERQHVAVRLDNHFEYAARVVGARSDLDIAVVLLVDPPRDLQPITVGSSAELQVGQSVLAIGSPYGLSATMTSGIISALDRTIESVVETKIPGVIQTDASINPGNSGGPLLDSAGHLIGMNTAIKSTSGGSAGIGFAIPVDTINRVVPQLIEGQGLVLPRVVLGFEVGYFRNRVMVETVTPGLGAHRAGLLGERTDGSGRWLAGDLLVSIDAQPISTIEDLWDHLREKRPGDTVEVEIARGLPYAEQRLAATVMLQARR